MANAQAILQNREIDIAALMTIRLVGTTQVFRFQNWLTSTFVFQGLNYFNLAFDLQSSGGGRGLINQNIGYELQIPEQKLFSVKRNSDIFDGLRDSLVAIAFIFPGQTDNAGIDVEPVRHQRFKVRSSLIKNSVMSLELDSLTDANFSAIGDLLAFPTFRRQHFPHRNAHYNYPR